MACKTPGLRGGTRGTKHVWETLKNGRKRCTRCSKLNPLGVAPEIRFWDHVEKEGYGGCWIWQGASSTDGYGLFTAKDTPPRKTYYAHRYSWMLAHNASEVPKGKVIAHSCDTPKCVNDGHLFLWTQQENLHDMVRKGRKANATVTPSQVREMRKLAEGGLPHEEIARRMNTQKGNVYRAVTGRTWKAI